MNEGLLPLDKFLSILNIDLYTYISNSSGVPYPIVNSSHQIVFPIYGDDKKLEGWLTNKALISRENTSPALVTKNNISTNTPLFYRTSVLFVDFRIFDLLDCDSISSINFRIAKNEVDYNSSTIYRSAREFENIDYKVRIESKISSYSLYYTCQGFLINSECKNNSLAPYNFASNYFIKYHNYDIYNKICPKYYNFDVLNPQSLFIKSFKSIYNYSENSMSTKTDTSTSESTMLDTVVNTNRQALIIATKLEVGGLALDLLTENVTKALPEPFQIIINGNPLVKIAIANLVSIVIQQTGIDDPRVLAINEAMLTRSWMDTIGAFDFKSILEDVITKIPAGKLSTLTDVK